MFNDPTQALSGFKKGLYDLALIDYKMPNMNGLDLYKEMRKVDDKIKVCFVTAFEVYYKELKNRFQPSSIASPKHKEEEEIRCFLQKPIDLDELVKRVKEELDS